MVGEFPELQGIMGGHYARHQGEDPRVAEAIAQHYRPLGPNDDVPREPVAVAVALADKLDQLAGFFAVGEKPTGSGDPYALRRAGIGVVRIIRENGLRLPLAPVLTHALLGDVSARPVDLTHSLLASIAATLMLPLVKLEAALEAAGAAPRPLEAEFPFDAAEINREVRGFLLDRLRVQLRAEGLRHDVVAAATGEDDDITRILARAEALKSLVESDTGANLLSAWKRAQNILRAEEKKDGPHDGPVEEAALAAPEEQALNAALAKAEAESRACLAREDFAGAMAALAALRAPTDAFFEKILVNDPAFRKNRLRLLSRLRAAMDAVADLSKIEA
jgi:glycyl-tRNA synthetase beta chain